MTNETLQTIYSRRSCRAYKPQQITDAELDAVLEAGSLAPTACNLQPQRIYILQSDAALSAIRGITPCAFNAPVVLLVCGDTGESWNNPYSGHDAAEMDATIAATHMMLKAAELGLGTNWVCFFDHAKVKEAFSLPQGVEPYCLLPLGYPADTACPSEQHGSRKPLSQTVFYK